MLKLLLILATVLQFAPARSANAQITQTSVKLRWTAAGDDSLIGRATSYDLRYSTAPITAANFASATRWTGLGLPGLPGTADSTTVTGLAPATQYWFAVKTADEVPNWSAVSNILGPITTLAPPDTTRPAPIIDLRLGWYDIEGHRVLEPSAPGVYFSVNEATGERRMVVLTRSAAFPDES